MDIVLSLLPSISPTTTFAIAKLLRDELDDLGLLTEEERAWIDGILNQSCIRELKVA